MSGRKLDGSGGTSPHVAEPSSEDSRAFLEDCERRHRDSACKKPSVHQPAIRHTVTRWARFSDVRTWSEVRQPRPAPRHTGQPRLRWTGWKLGAAAAAVFLCAAAAHTAADSEGSYDSDPISHVSEYS